VIVVIVVLPVVIVKMMMHLRNAIAKAKKWIVIATVAVNKMTEIILKFGKEKPMMKKHPWVFSGAIDKIKGETKAGETVKILSAQGRFLAYAGFCPNSQIRARVWSFSEKDKIDVNFFKNKFKNAIALRESLGLPDKETNAFRLINAEADDLPGLIVDKYDDVLVMQCLTAGAEYWKQIWADILMEVTKAKTVYERSDSDGRQMEGLPFKNGLLRGQEVMGMFEIKENGLKFLVDIKHGHKTGFYLDQRNSRQAIKYFAKDKEVLNCFCYTGGFSVYALDAGAKKVISVDASKEALEIAKENVKINKLSEKKCEWLEADVFELLREYEKKGQKFDLIVLDPPKFSANQGQLERALRGYKDINRLAFKLLNPNGILFTFSCSGTVSELDFQTAVAWGALDAGVEAKIIKKLSQGGDHPVALNFPEASYLKGFVLVI